MRLRTILYPALLVVCTSLLVWGVGSRASTEVSIGRTSGPSFIELPDGQIASAVRLKLENESDQTRHYTIMVGDADARLRTPQTRWEVKGRRAVEVPLYVDVPRASFARGRRTVTLKIADDAGFHRALAVTLLGPDGGTP